MTVLTIEETRTELARVERALQRADLSADERAEVEEMRRLLALELKLTDRDGGPVVVEYARLLKTGQTRT